jgi:hypothetical protein
VVRSVTSLEGRLTKVAAKRQQSQRRLFTAFERDNRVSQVMAAAEHGAPVHPRIVEILDLARTRRTAAAFADLA